MLWLFFTWAGWRYSFSVYGILWTAELARRVQEVGRHGLYLWDDRHRFCTMALEPSENRSFNWAPPHAVVDHFAPPAWSSRIYVFPVMAAKPVAGAGHVAYFSFECVPLPLGARIRLVGGEASGAQGFEGTLGGGTNGEKRCPGRPGRRGIAEIWF